MSGGEKKNEVKKLVGDTLAAFAALITGRDAAKQLQRAAPGWRPPTPKHPRDILAERREKRNWRKWEIEKIWAPRLDKDGKPFDLAGAAIMTRQQRRAEERKKSFEYVNAHFGFEKRCIRRSISRDRLRYAAKSLAQLAAAAK